MTYSKQQCLDAFNKLSEQEKAFFTSEAVADAVANVANDYSLVSERHRLLGEEVAYVLLHLNTPNEFEESIRIRISLTADDAGKISHEINETIFSSKAQNQQTKTENPQSTAPINPAASAAPIASIQKTAPQPQTTPAMNPSVATTPTNLPAMPEHHDLMKYYAGTEPIMPEQIDYSGPVPLKKKDSPVPPKLADTPRYQPPRYIPGTDPYREPSQ